MVARIVKDRKVSLVIVGQAFSLEIISFALEGRLAVCGGLVVRLLVREFPSTSLIQKEIEFYAKTQQLCGSLGGHQNVAAFQIAMHDARAVRVHDGGAHGAKQLQPAQRILRQQRSALASSRATWCSPECEPFMQWMISGSCR